MYGPPHAGMVHRYNDQLGMAATTGHGAMCRQCLVGGNYSLLDQNDGFNPNPDWWSALLWKRLMGATMLAVSQVMPEMGNYQKKNHKKINRWCVGTWRALQ